MKKTLITTTILASLAFTQHATAESQRFEPENKMQTEVIGFGSGILAGAAIGGPVGGFIGGMMGILIADEVNDEKSIEAQLIALKQADEELERQSNELLALHADLHSMKKKQMMQTVNFEKSQQQMLQERIGNMQTNIQFQTSSVAIEDVYHTQLASIAEILQQFPELNVRLEGFADQRGDSAFNQALSDARAEAVAKYLIALNVDKKQVTYAGNGEATQRDLNQSSKESLFFDRRVSIQLIPKGSILTAAK